MTSSDQSHSAAASALGYLYQSQWPLVELLRRARDEPDSALTLELHDDVAWEEDGTPTELLQVKHHVTAAGRLGDKDDDLWRTIRVWMDAHAPGDPSGPTLTLLTTETAAGGSAAAALRPAPLRDAAEGQRLLEGAARDSTAQASQDARTQPPAGGPGGVFRRRSRSRHRGMSLLGVRRHAPLPAEGYFPGFDGATGWLNTPPLTVEDLRRKVRAWAEKYRDRCEVDVFPAERALLGTGIGTDLSARNRT